MRYFKYDPSNPPQEVRAIFDLSKAIIGFLQLVGMDPAKRISEDQLTLVAEHGEAICHTVRSLLEQAKEEPRRADEPITGSFVTELLIDFKNKAGEDLAKRFIHRFGLAQRLRGIKPENYAALVAAVEGWYETQGIVAPVPSPDVPPREAGTRVHFHFETAGAEPLFSSGNPGFVDFEHAPDAMKRDAELARGIMDKLKPRVGQFLTPRETKALNRLMGTIISAWQAYRVDIGGPMLVP